MEKAKNNVIKITAILSSIIILTLVFLAIFEKRNIERANDGINQDMILTTTEISEKEYEAYGISEKAVKAVQVTATVTPAEAASICKLDWSVAWRDSNNLPVTNYVTVTPSSDGALTATVTFKTYFEQDIILKAVYRDDESIYATKLISCYERITNVNDFIFYADGESETLFEFFYNEPVVNINMQANSLEEFLDIYDNAFYYLYVDPYWKGYIYQDINVSIKIECDSYYYNEYLMMLESVIPVYPDSYDNDFEYVIYDWYVEDFFIEASGYGVIDIFTFLGLDNWDNEILESIGYDIDFMMFKEVFLDYFYRTQYDSGFFLVIEFIHETSGDITSEAWPINFVPYI